MDNISFGAKYITKMPVRSFFNNKKEFVQLVEMGCDKIDMKTLSDTSFLWNNRAGDYTFAQGIYNEMLDMEGALLREEKLHCYALTTQDKNFKKLIPEKILGLLLFIEAKFGANEIKYLQVDPYNNSVSNQMHRVFTHIGTTLVDFVKQRHPKRTIFVNSALNAIDFYKKNKFKTYNPISPENLYWG